MSRTKKPTVLAIKEGEPNKNRINKNEPQPKGKTTMPHFLNKDARNEWKRITPELEALGLLTRVDRAELSVYCQTYGRWVSVETKIQELIKAAEEKGGDASNAYLLKTQAGNVIISPLLSVANRCIEQMESALKEFGLTPASRTRINLEKPIKETDPMESLLADTGIKNRQL